MDFWYQIVMYVAYTSFAYHQLFDKIKRNLVILTWRVHKERWFKMDIWWWFMMYIFRWRNPCPIKAFQYFIGLTNYEKIPNLNNFNVKKYFHFVNFFFLLHLISPEHTKIGMFTVDQLFCDKEGKLCYNESSLVGQIVVICLRGLLRKLGIKTNIVVPPNSRNF